MITSLLSKPWLSDFPCLYLEDLGLEHMVWGTYGLVKQATPWFFCMTGILMRAVVKWTLCVLQNSYRALVSLAELWL